MDGFLRILVAEENEVDSFVIQCELSKLDLAFTFKRVASLDEFFAQLDEFHPNLVLANNQFDGIDIIHKARAIFPKIPVVMMVNAADEPTLDRLFKHGVTDCLLRKQLPQLKDCVEKVIKHCKENHGMAVPNPTCWEVGAGPKKSFLDRHFGAPPKPADASGTASRGIPAEAGAAVGTSADSLPMGTTFGAKLARIRNKFRPANPTSAEEPAPERRKELQTAACCQPIPMAEIASAVCAAPANPSMAGAGSSLLIDGMPSADRAPRLAERTQGNRDQFQDLEAEFPEGNILPERATHEFEKEMEMETAASPAVPAMDQDLKELLAQAQNFSSVKEPRALREEKFDQGISDQLQKLNRELRLQLAARKEAEADLQSSETAFKTVFDNSFLPLFLLDDSGAVMQANPAACSLLAFSLAEILGRRLVDFTEEENKPLREEAWSAFLAKGELRGERRLITAITNACDVEFTARAGVIKGLHLLVCRDISQQKILKDELAKARQQIGGSANDQSTQLKKLEELEFKTYEFHRKEELWNKTKHELDQLLMEKAHEIKNLTDHLKTELAHRQRMEEAIKALHAQLEKKMTEKTGDLEASNNELRLLSRFLQSTRDEDRVRLSRMVNESLEQNISRLQIDLAWVTQRLAQLNEGSPKKQLLEVLNSMEGMIGQSLGAIQQISKELARWIPRTAKRQ